MSQQHSQEQNTIEIMISNFRDETQKTKSYKDLSEQYQLQNRRVSLQWIDYIFLKIISTIRTLWSLLPLFLRGPSNQAQVFSNFVKKLKLKSPYPLNLSQISFEQTLKKFKFALMVGYTCNDNIRRDIKKLINNVKISNISGRHPLCPMNNLSQYFNEHIKPLFGKTYSVYVLLFALNLVGEVVFLEMYKPIDDNIQAKVADRITKFKNYEKELLQTSQETDSSMPENKKEEQHFKIPKVLQLDDICLENVSETKSEGFQ